MLVSGGRLVMALMALATIRAVTTLLTPAQYGELALLAAVQMFCGLFLVNPVGQHINLHTHAWWDDGTLSTRLRSYRLYIMLVSSVGSVIVLGVNKQPSVEQMLWAAVAMFGMVAAGTWNATLVPMLNMLGFRAASVFWSIITVTISLVSSILLVLWMSSATAWFAGQAIGMGMGAVGAKYVLRQHALPSKHSQIALPLLDRRTVLTYCLPLALATGLMWLQLSGYRFVIEGFWGLAQLGLMAIGLQLAGQVWALVESLAMQFLYPMFFRRVSACENDAEVELAFSDLLNTLVPVYFVFTGLVILSSPYLLKILVAPQLQDSMVFVTLGAGIELCRVLGNVLSNAAHVRRKTKSLTLPYAVGVVTTLTLIIWAGVWQMEIVWAGGALIIGGMAMLTTMWMCMRRQIRFTLDLKRWLGGAAVMVVMVALVDAMPSASGSASAIVVLMVVTIPASIVMFGLLWKNAAALRLLGVQLRKN